MSSPQQFAVARTAANLAAPLWAMQALVWTAGPKVQEQAAPYRITDTALYVAVVVVVLNGVAWLAWGNALASTRANRAAAHA